MAIKEEYNNQRPHFIRFFSGIQRLLTRRKLILLVIILVAVLGFRFWRSTQPKFEVTVREITREKFVESISASGEIAANEAITLNFETAGTVTEVNVKEGDAVEKGDVLSKLETTALYATYKSADAALRAAQASLDSTYDTLQGKEDSETFSEISTRTTAETTKDSAYWTFVVAQRNLSGAILKSPFNGIVTSVPDGLEIGTNISLPSSFAFSVVNPETIFFLVDVNEIDVPKLTSGQKVIVELDAYPGEQVEGVVEGINFGSTTTTTGGTAYEVRVKMPANDALKYRLGMNGDARFVISEQEEKLLVPQSAVSQENGNSFVWIVQNTGKVKKVQVETGASSINDIEIVSGLSDGQKVIERPPSKLEEGDRVKSK